jgi:hypothetical protein
MSWKVAIPRPVRRKIAGFNLPPPIEARMYRELQRDLGAVEHLLSKIVAPVRCGTWKIVVADPQALRAHAFFFWIDETHEPGTRIVIDADYTLLD